MDGNGRTARLWEFYILMRSGIPSIASHILSNHYNDTRAVYYRQLQHAAETGDLSTFIQYAIEGFRDGLEKTIAVIHKEQTELTWNNYVHDVTEKMQDGGLNLITLRRDLSLLSEKELLKTEKNKYRSNYELLYNLMPEASAPIKPRY